MEILDSTTAPGSRADSQLDVLIERAAAREDDSLGRRKANEAEARYRDRAERHEAQARERNRCAWVAHHESQRRAHLQIALEHRARSRELREAS